MISITDPIQPAIAHTRRMLFEPFSAQKWFVLGFCAFLATLGSGGSYNYNGNPFDRTQHGTGPDFSAAGAWISDHLPLVIGLGVLVFVFILALSVLFQWLSSRGQFMFLDGVAWNRAEVAEPWTRFQPLGDQLFRFRLMLLLVTIAFLAVCVGLGILIALPDLRAKTFGGSALIAVLGAGGLLILGLIVLGFISALLRDFIVPIMYRRNVGTSEAWTVWRQELLPDNGWRFVGFYLMTFLLWIGAALLMLLGCCLTCCLALLPYLSSVVFLPIFVFFRSYSLGFLAQFGDEWTIIEAPESQI
jgi:uncharacterized membrane protein (DUF485 family)